MTITVLLILAVLWAAVLVPPVLRSRSEGRRGETIGPLNYRLGSGGSRSDRTLGSMFNRPAAGPGGFRPAAFPARSNGLAGAPAGTAAPTRPTGDRTPAQKRRRDVLVMLLAAVAITFAVAVFTGMIAAWLLHVLVDALLGGYVCLLVQLKRRGAVGVRAALPPPIPLERPRQARHVAHRSPEFALRRTAGS